jgi:hypothetical protein
MSSIKKGIGENCHSGPEQEEIILSAKKLDIYGKI